MASDEDLLHGMDMLIAGMEWDTSAGMLATLYGRALFSRYIYGELTSTIQCGRLDFSFTERLKNSDRE